MSKQSIVVVGGPSGAGKTTTIKEMAQEYTNLYEVCVTSTTRAPRLRRRSTIMEVHEVDYFFRQKDEFERMIDAGKILEYDIFPPGEHGNYYRCERQVIDAVLTKGKIPLLALTAPGAVAVAQAYPGQCISIFIQPESIDFLKQMILAGKTQPPPDFDRRIAAAEAEIARAQIPGNYDFVILNRAGKQRETVQRIHSIVCEIIESRAVLV